MLALSMRMTLFGPGNGFIRSSNVSMKWRKVIALNEPSTCSHVRHHQDLLPAERNTVCLSRMLLQLMHAY
ncbi:hypothetical protein BJV74DRAFT_872571, partial [Russula compacta]